MTPEEWENACEKLDAIVAEIIKANPIKIEQIKKKPAMVGWLIGQVMKATDGQMPPKMIDESVNTQLGF